ncbi:unnamed protein product [Arctia plantaginis]|uniref:Uncharacterized protein n=1 Tax=Arctia plantaginis TaxID=874455 RepID=A0A8S0YU68_ARCPL|nr:unnamed protein product [Arctia plantaginis]
MISDGQQKERDGKRRRGRPMKRWSDDIIATAGKERIKQAKDRENWIKLEEAYGPNRGSYPKINVVNNTKQ